MKPTTAQGSARNSKGEVPKWDRRRGMERETGFEPATNSLEGCDSTPELLPPDPDRVWWRVEDSNLRRAWPGRFTVCCF